MKLVSVNVSVPIDVEHQGKIVKTGIFKSPVQGEVQVATHNLHGDGQADLVNHGGEHKAVYAYAQEHYDYWQQALGVDELPFGKFGENLTIAGLNESTSYIGDQLQIGTAVFVITQPRVPCFKLGIRFGNPGMPKLFTKSARTGFYLKVIREGCVEAGNNVHLLQQGQGQVSVKELFQAYFSPQTADTKSVYRRVVDVPGFSPEWRRIVVARM